MFWRCVSAISIVQYKVIDGVIMQFNTGNFLTMCPSAVDTGGKSGHALADFLILINFNGNVKLSSKLFTGTR
jgi:hypothetical protein